MKDGEGVAKTWIGKSGVWFENVKLDMIRHRSGDSHVPLTISPTVMTLAISYLCGEINWVKHLPYPLSSSFSFPSSLY